MNKHKYAVIINPKSGTGKQKGIEHLLNKTATSKNIALKIVYTEYAGHACSITEELRDKIDVIIVVGGDGSVNEVGRTLIGSTTALGIIPTGSGNGLARHLGYSMNRTPPLVRGTVSTPHPDGRPLDRRRTPRVHSS